MNIGERIKTIRTSLKISGRQLALKSDVSPAQISMIENNTAKPSIDLLERICKVFNISLSQFFADEVSTHSPELIRLIKTAEELSPEQLNNLVKFINSMKKV